MAKIGTAQVETLHIADGAVSEYAHGSGVSSAGATVANDGAQPVAIWVSGTATYDSEVSGQSGSMTLTVKRTRDGAVLSTQTENISGSGISIVKMIAQILDTSAGLNESYTVTGSTIFQSASGPGNFNMNSAVIDLEASRK